MVGVQKTTVRGFHPILTIFSTMDRILPTVISYHIPNVYPLQNLFTAPSSHNTYLFAFPNPNMWRGGGDPNPPTTPKPTQHWEGGGFLYRDFSAGENSALQFVPIPKKSRGNSAPPKSCVQAPFGDAPDTFQGQVTGAKNGLGRGSQRGFMGTPTYKAQNDPHNALITLRHVSRAKFDSKIFLSGALRPEF